MKQVLILLLVMLFLPLNSKREVFNEFVSKFQVEATIPFFITREEVIDFDARAYFHGGNFAKIDSVFNPFIKLEFDTNIQKPNGVLGVNQSNYFKKLALSEDYTSLVYYVESFCEGNNSYYSFILSTYDFEGAVISSITLGHYHNYIDYQDKLLEKLNYQRYDSLFFESDDIDHSFYYVDVSYIVSSEVVSKSKIRRTTKVEKELRVGEQDGPILETKLFTEEFSVQSDGTIHK